MSDLSRTNVLIIIPKSQFCGQELNGVRTILQQCGANVVVLSKSGQETRGMNKEKFQPDGMIVDWNKQIGVEGCTKAKIGCIECKGPVIDSVISELGPIQERIAKYQSNPNLIQEIIFDGSERARSVAKNTLEEVRDAMGITY